jgi:hypothetical protein
MLRGINEVNPFLPFYAMPGKAAPNGQSRLPLFVSVQATTPFPDVDIFRRWHKLETD